MKIEDIANERELRHVGLELSVDEATELRDTLETLLGDPKPRHEHVSSKDYERELTIWILRE